MGLFDQFPYTNFHELNLMWILEALKEIQTTTEQFVAINSLKYANPIQWNIVKQYEKNTIVIDPLTGTAYISVQPVPVGVQLFNTDYWTKVFDLGAFVVRAAKNFTSRYEEGATTAATFNSVANDWLVWGDTLYKATVNITAGDSYVEGGNIQRITVEEAKNEIVNQITTIISNTGDLADLSTTDKSNLVAAINEVLTTLTNTSGDLADLSTTDKSNLVAAINEVLTTLTNTSGDLADLSTIDKSNLVAAINEVLTSISTVISDRPYINVKDYGAVGDGITDDFNSFSDAYQAASEGSAIIVPFGTYNISANPDDHSKNIKWIFDYGTLFVGAGSQGGLDGVKNGFTSPATNPFNRIARTNSKIYNNMASPVGGGICVDSLEVQSSNRTNKTITATITNGSSVMTNISDLKDIAVGDSILAPDVSGWLDGSTRANSVRVVAIDRANNTITFGSTPAPNALPGDGWCVATPWNGASQTNQFIIRPRIWTVNQYIGLDTSSVDNIDEFGYLINGVLNVNGGVGNAIELDINLVGHASGGTNGILLTGIGDYSDPNYGIRINRGGRQNWTTGIDIQNCIFGIGITAYEPILIRTAFYNNQTQATQEPYFGIVFDNINDLVPTTRPLLGGEQLVNNATCILLARANDADPQGAFIRCMSKDRQSQLFVVGINGNVIAQDYRIMKPVTAGTGTITGYITVYDQSNNPVKLAVIS